MATLRQRIAAGSTRFSFSDYAQWKTVGNASFPVSSDPITMPNGAKAETAHGFAEMAQRIYQRNGVVFACMAVRQSVFSEVRFRFANVQDGKLGGLFGTNALALLERPWPNGTTGELASRMIQDADLAGNFYATVRNGRIYRLDPGKVSIVLTGNPIEDDPTTIDVAGYTYQPNGQQGRRFTYLPHDVCHWSPIPDPTASYRGMSWLTPVLREIEADGAATDHKAQFFRNGATPQFAVTIPQEVMSPEQFDDFRRKMLDAHTGYGNAYKTLYLAPGADVKALGVDLKQLSFDDTQGRDETRIAAASGVPAAIVGIKESLQGSSLNTGNYSAARRRFADGTMRPLYRSASSALESIVPPPQTNGSSQLWYDDSQVAFFREDRADSATIQQTKSTSIKTLVDAGYEPDSVIAAVEAEDMSLLKHSGLYSVQLQAPGDFHLAPPTP